LTNPLSFGNNNLKGGGVLKPSKGGEMPIFYYEALGSGADKTDRGKIEADDESDARAQLGKQGLIAITLRKRGHYRLYFPSSLKPLRREAALHKRPGLSVKEALKLFGPDEPSGHAVMR